MGKLKGGVIIIGSLLWDTDESRNIWRESSLNLKQAYRVYLPIRYGRKSRSRNHTYTMVFSTKCYLKSYGLGIGWIVPIGSEIDSFEDLKEEARRMGETEGFQNGFSISWGSVALKFNPRKTIDSKIIEKWSNFMSVRLVNHQLFSNKLKTEKSVIDSNGFLKIRWPQKIEPKTNQDALDFLISTVTLPSMNKGRYPTIYQIANSMINYEYYTYFLNNKKIGIETFQDQKILKKIKAHLCKDYEKN